MCEQRNGHAEDGRFSAGSVVVALVALIGILAYGVIVRRIEPTDWSVSGARAPNRGYPCDL